jgi:hypothetical protein
MFGEEICTVDDLLAVLDQLAAQDLAGLPDTELSSRVERWCTAKSRLDALGARLVGEWDERMLWVHDGATSGAAWLRAHGDVERTKPLVDTARSLRDHAPATSAALTDGELSYEKAAALVSAVTPALADVFAEDEERLLRAAGRLDVAETKRLAAQWRKSAEAELDGDPHEKVRARRDLTVWQTRDGLLGIKGFLDPDQSPAALAAVEARADDLWHDDVRKARADAGMDPADDNHEPAGVPLARTAGQRRADALTDLILLGAGARGVARESDCIGGPSAQLHLTMPATTVMHAAAERVQRALTVPGIDPEERRALRAALAVVGDRPVAGRLVEGPVPAFDDYAMPPDPILIGVLACDCVLQRVVLDAAGVPLDVGRTQRLATPAQRRALIVRDGGCAFPGCDRPPGWCDAHHIIPWELGGHTDMHNLVLLCRRHHRRVHAKHPWRCRIDRETGRPEFYRPDGTRFVIPVRAGAPPGAHREAA